MKHVYATRNIERISPIDALLRFTRSAENNFYRGNEPLSFILEDIRTELSLQKDTSIASVLPKLDQVIGELGATSPFDALERNQKDYFEAIRQRAGDRYGDIKNDLEKLADEVIKKNDLVQIYLGGL